jgi:hypothetical protein
MLSKLTLPGILLILTIPFGFWLSQAGKPYNSLLFNIHKLVALGAVVWAAIQIAKMLQQPGWLLIATLIVAALCIVALFVSGALMSAGQLDYALMLSIHRVAPVVLGIALVWSGFLLVSFR